MKTAVIYDQLDAGIRLLLQDGDWSRFNGVYINAADSSPEVDKELSALLFDEHGAFLGHVVSNKEFAAEIRIGAEVIICGWIP